ncbi:hypothetical protein HJG60_008514 [Phyllostomus discolor]|uniref:Uncharacterized protein n=1 Tax=Phyllostomus discolor TaxID=89673 RepID=A0A833Z383_9CHIR|nr:hypothetical protein HJG60_008514 [Phyllostomus discolor]
MMCLGVGLCGFLLIGTLCVSWICVTCSLIKLGKFSFISFSTRFSIPCSSSSPSGIPVVRILLCFILSCISLNPSLFFLSLFSFSCSFWMLFSALSSSSLIRSSASLILLFIPSTVFFSLEIVFFISSSPLLRVSISFFMFI